VKGGEVVEMIMISEMTERYELSLVHLTDMDEEDGVESLVELIHKVAMKELYSRSLESVWDWELRTKNMFVNNHLHKVGDVAGLPIGKVNRLIGCGYTTRKEVYDVFWQYHLRLKYWEPDKHYSRGNYKF
jgi:hypothetical protein